MKLKTYEHPTPEHYSTLKSVFFIRVYIVGLLFWSSYQVCVSYRYRLFIVLLVHFKITFKELKVQGNKF